MARSLVHDGQWHFLSCAAQQHEGRAVAASANDGPMACIASTHATRMARARVMENDYQFCGSPGKARPVT